MHSGFCHKGPVAEEPLDLAANGLQRLRAFVFAFSSAQEAADACLEAGPTAAGAWLAFSEADVEVDSVWAPWTKHRRSCQRQVATRKAVGQPSWAVGRASRQAPSCR